jgi:hypothetical protein
MRGESVPFSCEPKRSPTRAASLGYVPLAQRTADDLQSDADRLRRMAATATTAGVARALLTLADRFAAAAETRRAG